MFHSITTQISILGIAAIVFVVIFTSWGLDDLDGLLAHPARATLLFLLLVQFIAIGFFLPPQWSSRLPNQLVVEDNLLITFIGAMGILLFLMISPFSDRHQWMLLSSGDTLRYFGLWLFMLGVIFSLWTAIHICKRFRIRQQAYQLMTDGPFKYVRHPRELGQIMIFIGIPLVFLSSLGLLLAILSAAGLLERIGRKEQILRQQFKDEWLAYARNTKCLIPWISISKFR
jgi:protein-S-isoprenylcysteine O-methyltransferase Ste14